MTTTTVYVQFTDSTETTVCSVFSCPQDPTQYPNQAEIDSSDPRYIAFVNPGSTLSGAKTAQIAALQSAYELAISAPVNFTTAAGTTATFSQSAQNVANLQSMLLAGEKSQTWPLNLWLDSAGVPITPFTYADMQGLAAAMEAYDAPQYADLLAKVAQVQAATTVAQVQSVTF
jgi:hypothetical protein